MGILEYTIVTNVLLLKRNEKVIYTWFAVSGGNGGDPLPKGRYDIGVGRMVNWAQAKMKKGFQSPNGKGFFISLKPKFSTTRGTVENGRFGIHPDGGKPGTHGCIGIKSNAFTFLSYYNKYKPKLLIVK